MNGLKRLGKGIYAFLPHLLITYSVMALTFYCINRVNEAMNFLTARISTGFQTLYCLLILLTVGCALVLHSKARWFGVPCMLGAAVLFVPICRAFLQDNPMVASEAWYRTVLMLTACFCLLFAVAQIVVQRKAAMAAYRAATLPKTVEESPEPVPAPAD